MTINAPAHLPDVELRKTLVASNYANQVLQQQPEAIQSDFNIDQFKLSLSLEDIRALTQQVLKDISTEPEWMQVIRRLRARLMFRWIWQDANQLTDVVTLTRELSDFADVAIQEAVNFSRPQLVEKYGEPVGDDGQVQDLIVIGMGKLGARELNLSSDIDLIFAFDESGETTGRRSTSIQQFCVQWGQAVIRLLDTVTPDGFVFRVDMRLRPWGDGSALACNYVSLERYLEQHGREWERYAWIKARIITGGVSGDNLLRMTRPFVYRRYVDFSAFAALREMKGLIEREQIRRNVQGDIKLGSGGIREIEFIVQAFQLIYGGTWRELRVANCLSALDQLGQLELMPLDDVEELSSAYLFLRRLEHGIQAQNDQQTQHLPVDHALQQRLAESLNFSDWASLLESLEQVRDSVRAQFADVVADRRVQQRSLNLEELSQTLHRHLDDEARVQLQAFWDSRLIQGLPTLASERLQAFWPQLLDALLSLSEPKAIQTTLLRLLPLIEAVVRRSVYLVLLLENPKALLNLVRMVHASPWICEELTRYPVLLDEFLAVDLYQLPSREDLSDSLRQELLRIERDDVEEQMRVLRLFKKSHVLQVAASDVLAERPLMKISDALTDIAEVVLETVLQLALAPLVARHGWPLRASNYRENLNGERANSAHPQFAIIGYGKLGGIEMSYSSDLDLVFLHDVDEQADTDGEKPLSGFQFCARLAQKMMTMLSTQTLDGRIYEVDTRLRPSGQAGLLVSSLHAFELYQQKSAWLWEHQALARSRSVAGDQTVRDAFEQIRLAILTLPRDPLVVREEVRAMRQKMQDHLGSSKTQQENGFFHLKQDAGGIVDIEFMAQYGVLAWANAEPALAHYSDNVRILDALATAGRLSRADANALTDAYLRERFESHRLALANQSLQVQAADWLDTRTTVRALWQQLIDPTAD
ncbi:bifunctional [glutamate--ammonia ligase]-adenylyl-L-tyrosine phosphorylase/[glutamate--ammonia-ligase] adenylyltransferase [Aquirhabdus parva]|uniref:Bifunctional glutamine synthetase adenylyltransferase/adenylyl-removing enzyme n=1 Tax=Aquirhabdus parva TaxID=2283318 RepID=A0A345P749_9GAMM|nr:bifunctional [glutamate--ammonia ligase]-adenylyl-L-tyrosine phosphorylase/[glutamate--ammonia-ligase] adenylyltransferase [Aquirhabdus parva]AXI03108.1 bifunctional [glutamate--ammonia ligase]-adenylyl-L-tyrosine phosphorylase/[glutamate--ammonia-ligase] adenylyltransferase [Aquirhabdus parva]